MRLFGCTRPICEHLSCYVSDIIDVNIELLLGKELEIEQIKARFFAGDITRMNVALGFAISREWNLNNVVQWEENHELEDRMTEE